MGGVVAVAGGRVVGADHHRIGRGIGRQQGGGLGGHGGLVGGHVDHDQQTFAAERAGERVDLLAVGVDQFPVAGGHHRVLVAQRDETLVERVH